MPPPPEPAGPAPGIEFAPHGPRIVAYLLDALVLVLVVAVVTILLVVVATSVPEPAGVIVALALIALLLVAEFSYFPWFWLRSGQTPGMRPFRLFVVRDRDGGPIDGRTAVLRAIGLFFVSPFVLYVGFAWALIDARRRTWHDLLAGTVVVRR